MTNSSGYLENRYGVLLFSIGSHQNEKKASVYVAMPGERVGEYPKAQIFFELQIIDCAFLHKYEEFGIFFSHCF